MDDNRGPELAAVLIALLVLATVAVGLRMYSMAILVKRFMLEDWLTLVTLVVYIAYTTFGLLAVHYGLGAHVYDVPLHNHSKALLWRYVAQTTYIVISASTKFIVGLLLLRVCSRQKWRTWTIWTMLGISAVANTFYFFLSIFQCQPIEFYWFRYDPNPPVQGKCHNSVLATIPSYIVIVLNVAVDWGLALLPVSVVWNAKMQIKLKISVVGLLALGSIASIATIVRIPYAKQLLSSPDYLYNFTDIAIWSSVEIGLALTASSLATLKPFLRKMKFLTGGSSKERVNTYVEPYPTDDVTSDPRTQTQLRRSESVSSDATPISGSCVVSQTDPEDLYQRNRSLSFKRLFSSLFL
ncbi:hypothetical protein B0I35DRAFT_471999 [Stachybotrys elegans]|uniref:Rhodopsin domain-containing protein n=1 Tax=Stachybotrys elegans TaxID=80388 RepID=A0A8K0SIQ6_9HYPO|nr:hypothetical protein B0I35DRAFT_471999 [Stachybotrys elegans]